MCRFAALSCQEHDTYIDPSEANGRKRHRELLNQYQCFCFIALAGNE